MSHTGHVVLACDKFKGSLTALDVAQWLARGVADVRPDLATRRVPVADGGEGTLAAAITAGFRRVPVRASGPTGEPVDTAYAVRGDTAVVELADACGLSRLPGGTPAPLTASSRGAGEVLSAALDAGVAHVVLGVGGSASTDGGAGLLAALGGRLLDRDGRELPGGGAALARLARLDLRGLDPRLRRTRLTLASDVANPLLGAGGAVAVFSPQKGAGPAERAQLEAGLAAFAAQVTRAMGRDDTRLPGAGAAGGVGYVAQAVLGARMLPGVDVVLGLARFADVAAGAALVITGEGALDAQTLLGKAPAGVARAARALGVPVVAVCGRNELTSAQAADLGIGAVYALSDLEPDPALSMAQAGPLTRRAAARAVAALLPPGR
jgi:glycerate kinase